MESDLIRRQDAIDAVDRIARTDNWQATVSMVLLDLPSAQPETNCSEFPNNSDIISRQSAIELANSLKDDLPDDERIADAVMAHNEGILEYQTALSLVPSAKQDFDMTEKIDKAHDDGYKQGYLQGKADYERKTGKWILTHDEQYEYCTCSECGYENGENWMIGADIPFCANCGADMRGDEE